MFCRDASLTLLARHGYNVVRLPRTGIEPLDILGRDPSGIEQLGQLPAIWTTREKVPQENDCGVAAEIKTVSTGSLGLSVGLRVLEGILSGLGAAVPRLDFAYGDAKSLQLSFANISIKKIDLFEIGRFLKNGQLQLDNPLVRRYLLGKGTTCYVITEVLKSDAVTVLSLSEKSTSAQLDLTAIQNTLGAAVKAEVGSGSSSQVTYRGATHLTFGFKAFRIGYSCGATGPGEWYVAGINPNKADVYLDASQKELKPELIGKRFIGVGPVDLQ